MDRTPFELHRLRGNPGKRRHFREMQPEIPEKPPNPPDFLSPGAKAEWERLAPELHRVGLLTTLDLGPFSAYCEAAATWIEVVTAESDPRRKRLLQSMAGDWAKSMLQLGRHFGLSPRARTRLRGNQVDGDGGRFDGLLGG